jgi:hypothetical protein
MSALSVKPENSPTTDSAMSTAHQVQLLVLIPQAAFLAIPHAQPALSTPANAQAALHAADHFSTSNALLHAQLVPIPSTEPANTALTAAPPALDQTLPAHLAHQERSSTMELAMINAPSL